MEQSNTHGYLCSFSGHGLVCSYEGVALKIIDRLGNTPKQNTNTDAGTKQHREPSKVTKLWSF